MTGAGIKGVGYGTTMVDLDRLEVPDVLEGRSADGTAVDA
jgi:hypothetical protein